MVVDVYNSLYKAYSEIIIGDTFWYNDQLYIKTDDLQRSAVRLATGVWVHFEPDEPVIPALTRVVTE